MTSPFQVLVRVRPVLQRVDGKASESILELESNSQHQLIHVEGAENRRSRSYSFDRVITGNDGSVNELVGEPALASTLEGYNACVFAYGQTSSGKTHTIFGCAPRGSVQLPQCGSAGPRNGLLSGMATDLFSSIAAVNRADPQVSIRVGLMIVEVYNETVLNLLPPPPTEFAFQVPAGAQLCEGVDTDATAIPPPASEMGVPLVLRDAPDGGRGVVVSGAAVYHVSTEDEVRRLIARAHAARHVGDTKMNVRSSRSHAICQFIVVQTRDLNDVHPAPHAATAHAVDATDGAPAPAAAVGSDGSVVRAQTVSTLTVVDLAGSERLSKSGSSGARQGEAVAINKSLHMLGRALSAFSEDSRAPRAASPARGARSASPVECKRTTSQRAASPARCGKGDADGFVPLRDSKLTRLLAECFGGNARVWMIACVAAARVHASETLSTLDYASRAKSIRNNAVVNRQLLGVNAVTAAAAEQAAVAREAAAEAARQATASVDAVRRVCCEMIDDAMVKHRARCGLSKRCVEANTVCAGTVCETACANTCTTVAPSPREVEDAKRHAVQIMQSSDCSVTPPVVVEGVTSLLLGERAVVALKGMPAVVVARVAHLLAVALWRENEDDVDGRAAATARDRGRSPGRDKLNAAAADAWLKARAHLDAAVAQRVEAEQQRDAAVDQFERLHCEMAVLRIEKEEASRAAIAAGETADSLRKELEEYRARGRDSCAIAKAAQEAEAEARREIAQTLRKAATAEEMAAEARVERDAQLHATQVAEAAAANAEAAAHKLQTEICTLKVQLNSLSVTVHSAQEEARLATENAMDERTRADSAQQHSAELQDSLQRLERTLQAQREAHEGAMRNAEAALHNMTARAFAAEEAVRHANEELRQQAEAVNVAQQHHQAASLRVRDVEDELAAANATLRKQRNAHEGETRAAAAEAQGLKSHCARLESTLQELRVAMEGERARASKVCEERTAALAAVKEAAMAAENAAASDRSALQAELQRMRMAAAAAADWAAARSHDARAAREEASDAKARLERQLNEIRANSAAALSKVQAAAAAARQERDQACSERELVSNALQAKEAEAAETLSEASILRNEVRTLRAHARSMAAAHEEELRKLAHENDTTIASMQAAAAQNASAARELEGALKQAHGEIAAAASKLMEAHHENSALAQEMMQLNVQMEGTTLALNKAREELAAAKQLSESAERRAAEAEAQMNVATAEAAVHAEAVYGLRKQCDDERKQAQHEAERAASAELKAEGLHRMTAELRCSLEQLHAEAGDLRRLNAALEVELKGAKGSLAEAVADQQVAATAAAAHAATIAKLEAELCATTAAQRATVEKLSAAEARSQHLEEELAAAAATHSQAVDALQTSVTEARRAAATAEEKSVRAVAQVAQAEAAAECRIVEALEDADRRAAATVKTAAERTEAAEERVAALQQKLKAVEQQQRNSAEAAIAEIQRVTSAAAEARKADQQKADERYAELKRTTAAAGEATRKEVSRLTAQGACDRSELAQARKHAEVLQRQLQQAQKCADVATQKATALESEVSALQTSVSRAKARAAAAVNLLRSEKSVERASAIADVSSAAASWKASMPATTRSAQAHPPPTRRGEGWSIPATPRVGLSGCPASADSVSDVSEGCATVTAFHTHNPFMEPLARSNADACDDCDVRTTSGLGDTVGVLSLAQRYDHAVINPYVDCLQTCAEDGAIGGTNTPINTARAGMPSRPRKDTLMHDECVGGEQDGDNGKPSKTLVEVRSCEGTLMSTACIDDQP